MLLYISLAVVNVTRRGGYFAQGIRILERRNRDDDRKIQENPSGMFRIGCPGYRMRTLSVPQLAVALVLFRHDVSARHEQRTCIKLRPVGTQRRYAFSSTGEDP